jgi:hypothetical protein
MYFGFDCMKSDFEINPIFFSVVILQLKVARPSIGLTELSEAAINGLNIMTNVSGGKLSRGGAGETGVSVATGCH